MMGNETVWPNPISAKALAKLNREARKLVPGVRVTQDALDLFHATLDGETLIDGFGSADDEIGWLDGFSEGLRRVRIPSARRWIATRAGGWRVVRPPRPTGSWHTTQCRSSSPPRRHL
jgi:hypothetical protein